MGKKDVLGGNAIYGFLVLVVVIVGLYAVAGIFGYGYSHSVEWEELSIILRVCRVSFAITSFFLGLVLLVLVILTCVAPFVED